MRIGKTVGALAFALIATSAAAGCSSGTATGTGKQETTATASASPTRAPDPTASAEMTPATRTDAKATSASGTKQAKGEQTKGEQTSTSSKSGKRIEAPAATAIVDEVSYSDGLQVAVTEVKSGKIEAVGPGEITGQPFTAMSVTVTNNSKQTIVLDQVIPQVRYGSPARIAPPVYNKDTRDLSGTLKPGQSTKAIYAFSIPRSDFSNVTFALDVDGQHGLAVFKGEVK